MKKYGVRRLKHRDHFPQYFAVTENGIDIAYTDTVEKAQRLLDALEGSEHGPLSLSMRQPA